MAIKEVLIRRSSVSVNQAIQVLNHMKSLLLNEKLFLKKDKKDYQVSVRHVALKMRAVVRLIRLATTVHVV